MPIIGNGDIATALRESGIDFSDFTVLASGLSNSSKVMWADYERELKMIRSYGHDRNHIVYFSSLCIYYTDSDYARYKQMIESTIKQTCQKYTIVRLGNIEWGTNPHTLLNYLKAHPEAERRDEIRYIVSKEEFLHWMQKIRYGVNDIMNIPGRMVNVKDLKL